MTTADRLISTFGTIMLAAVTFPAVAGYINSFLHEPAYVAILVTGWFGLHAMLMEKAWKTSRKKVVYND